jgi:hypothetical protein
MMSMVLASSLVRQQMGDAPRRRPREQELSRSGARHGLWDVARVATALGGLTLYAGALALLAR